MPSPGLNKKGLRASVKREARDRREEEDIFTAPKSIDDTFEVQLKAYEQPFQPDPMTIETQAQPKLEALTKVDPHAPFELKLKIFEQPFTIPTLPKGRRLEFTIL